MSIALFTQITRQEGTILDKSGPTPNVNTPNNVKVFIENIDEITLLSGESLSKIWDTPEEDEAWNDL